MYNMVYTIFIIQAKKDLLESIDKYVLNNIILAAKQISELTLKKIVNDDVIVVYSWYVQVYTNYKKN